MCLRSFVINCSCDHFDVWSATAIYYSKLELFNHRTVLHTEDNRKYRLASLMVFPIRQEKCTKTKKKNSERKIDDLIVVYPSHLFTHTHTHWPLAHPLFRIFLHAYTVVPRQKAREKYFDIHTFALCAHSVFIYKTPTCV